MTGSDIAPKRAGAIAHLALRPARNADGDGVSDLIASVFAQYPGCVFDRAGEFPELDAIADDFRASHGRMWVVEDRDGRILGCFGVKYDPATREAELHKVYLDQSCRGQGVAQRLLAKALTWLGDKHSDCETVMLWTDTRFEAGHRFYEKCGFTRTGQNRILDDLSQSSEIQFRLDFATYRTFLTI